MQFIAVLHSFVLHLGFL